MWNDVNKEHCNDLDNHTQCLHIKHIAENDSAVINNTL